MIPRISCILCFLALGAVTAPQVTSGAFTVDMTAPLAPTLLTPESAASIQDFYVRFSASATDALSGVAEYEFQLAGQAGQWTDSGFLVRRDLDSALYEWRCRAKDRAGNIGDWSSFSLFDLTYSVADDLDFDGLSDAWESDFFGALGAEPLLDSDRDGIRNIDEFDALSHPYEFYLDLQKGWNLLALPFNATDQGLAELHTHSVGDLWIWESDNWQADETPAAYAGFWLFSSDSAPQVPVSGQPVSHNTVSLAAGWNLTGSGIRSNVSDPESIVETAMNWDGEEYQSLSLASLQLEAFSGYWIQAAAGTISFPQN